MGKLDEWLRCRWSSGLILVRQMKPGDILTNIKVDVNLVRQMKLVKVLTCIKVLAFFFFTPTNDF